MLAKRIKELRISNDLTQKDLATYLGLTPKMISFYELGQRVPPSDIILKLANKFNVTTDYLLGRENLPINHSPEISPEELELLKQIKNASPEKQKAIELILGIKEESATIVNK